MMSLWRRLMSLLRRRRLDDDLSDEIELHVDLRRQALIDEGMDPRSADHEARRMFGNVLGIREETRDMWGFPLMDALMQDIRYGTRMLWRAPLFTAVAVLSLAIGVGASVAVFSVGDAVLFKSLAAREPQALHSLRWVTSFGAGSKVMYAIPRSDFEALERATDFADLTAFQAADPIPVSVSEASEAYDARVDIVSGDYFQELGVGAFRGRVIEPTDAVSGAPPVAVLSHRFWRSLLDADGSAVGRQIVVNGSRVTVIGVAPQGFGGLMIDRPADLFVPVGLSRLAAVQPPGTEPNLRVVARLPADGNPVVAAERLTALHNPIAQSSRKLLAPPQTVVILDPAAHGISDARPFLERPIWVLLGLSSILLALACANVGNLLLSRFWSRQTEFAVRLAIGAGARRLVQQVIVEAMLVAVLAATAGLIAARITSPMLVHLIPAPSGQLSLDLPIDRRLVAFASLISIAAALLVALATATRLVRMNASRALRADARSTASGRRSLARALIMAQVACSLVLLVGAGSMFRTVRNLWSVDPGYRVEGAFAITASPSHLTNNQPLPGYFEELRGRLSQVPGVSSASIVQFPLMGRAATTGTVDIAGFVPTSDDDRWANMFFVGPDFIQTTGMRLVRGRGIEAQDSSGAQPVSVVNQAFARFYFGASDPVGQLVNGKVRIVGLVADGKYNSLRDPTPRAMFVPHAQARTRSTMTLVVRSAPGAPLQDVVASATAAARAHDPVLRFDVVTMPEQLARSIARERFLALLIGLLSLLALTLACAGLYGVVAYAVSERRGEIGIRIALGARRHDVIRLVLGQPLLMTALGIAIGLPGAYAVTRAMGTLLFGIAPLDAITVLASSTLLFGISLAASLAPATRAASIDPQESMRCN